MSEQNETVIAAERGNDSVVDETYATLSKRYDKLYSFVMHYSEYIYSTHQYDARLPVTLTMIEVHTLSYIEDHPGTTPTELVHFWDKTKGAISQVLTRLFNLNLIEKRKENGNAKTLHLYVTEEGRQISQAHKLYDINDITKTMTELQKRCSMDELEAFYKVVAVYDDVIRADFEINSGLRGKKNKKVEKA